MSAFLFSLSHLKVSQTNKLMLRYVANGDNVARRFEPVKVYA